MYNNIIKKEEGRSCHHVGVLDSEGSFGERGAASILLCMFPSFNGFKQASWDFWLV
jgi:hypothetical protein